MLEGVAYGAIRGAHDKLGIARGASTQIKSGCVFGGRLVYFDFDDAPRISTAGRSATT